VVGGRDGPLHVERSESEGPRVTGGSLEGASGEAEDRGEADQSSMTTQRSSDQMVRERSPASVA
jgi:hypothetical protein